MAGHSKWANIKHRKAAQDAKRGKVFTKHSRELMNAAKFGHDPCTNPRLKTAIEKALAKNMTRDAVNKAIIRSTIQRKNGNKIQFFTYEGYGSGGIAIIVECMSDNKNRTFSYIRSIFNKCGCNMSHGATVNYLFSKKNIISCNLLEENNEEQIMHFILKIGADDFVLQKNNIVDILVSCENFIKVKTILEHSKCNIVTTKVSLIPNKKINLNQKEELKFLKLLQLLNCCQDIQKVHHNANIVSI